MTALDPVEGSEPFSPVRSYKHRRGRATSGQQRALDTLWPAYGIAMATAPLDLGAVYGRRAPVVLEIGFGMGEATLAMAAVDPDSDVLAVDVHTPGAGALVRGLAEQDLTNVRVVVGDAVEVLRDMLEPGSLAEVRVYFPDPWPKGRHRKRRLVGPDFVHLVATRLGAGGRLHCATDSEPYAVRILAAVSGEPLLVNAAGGYASRPPWRPVTRFEGQGLSKGHDVFDLIARRGG